MFTDINMITLSRTNIINSKMIKTRKNTISNFERINFVANIIICF